MAEIIATVIAFFVGLGIPAAVVTTAATLLVTTLLSVGISYLSSAINKPGWRGDTLQISLASDEPRHAVLGQTAAAGSLVTWLTWGHNNEYVVLIVALADHLCESLVGFWWGGTRATWTGGAVADANVNGTDYLWVTFHNGDWNQTAPVSLTTNSGGRFTSADRGRGIAYVEIEARYNEQAHPNGLAGLFQFIFELKGYRPYDRRKDTTVGGSGTQVSNDASTHTYSNNASVLTEQVLRGLSAEDTSQPVSTRARDRFFGLILDDTALPFAENTAAMNICDEPVAMTGFATNLVNKANAGDTVIHVTSTTGLTSGHNVRIDAGAANEEVINATGVTSSTITLAHGLSFFHTNYEQVDWAVALGGVTEARYTANGMIACDSDVETVLQDLSAAQAGYVATAGDRWIILAGAARTPSTPTPLLDGNLRLDVQHTYTQDQPLDELINAVYGRFADPNNQFNPTALPARLSPADELTDGGRKDVHLDLNFVTSNTQGQRVMEITRRKARRQRSAEWGLLPTNIAYEAGDWIEWTSSRYGFDLFFEIQQVALKTDDDDTFFTPIFSIQETDPQVYAWDPSVDQLSVVAPSTLASAAPTLDLVTTLVVTPTTAPAAGGATVPALLFSIDSPTDPLADAVYFEWRDHANPTGGTDNKTFAVVPALTAGTTVFVVTDGIGPGITYEARAILQTKPQQPASFTSWVVAGSVTGTQVSNGIIGQAPAATDPTVAPGATYNGVFVQSGDPTTIQGGVSGTYVVPDGALWFNDATGLDYKRSGGAWIATNLPADGASVFKTTVTGAWSYTFPATSLPFALIRLRGGGGGGDFGDGTVGAGGGGSGAEVLKHISVTPGSTTLSGTVGAGGLPGNFTLSHHATGGAATTCASPSMSAGGGGPGIGTSGNFGGTGTGGDTNTAGGNGANNSGANGGKGGDAPDSGGLGGAGGVGAVGTAGGIFGGGGGGGDKTHGGGVGAIGNVEIFAKAT